MPEDYNHGSLGCEALATTKNDTEMKYDRSAEKQWTAKQAIQPDVW